MRFCALKSIRIAALALCATPLLASCGKQQQPQPAAQPAPATKPAPPTPIDEKKAELGGPTWNPEWDQIVEQAIPPAMLSPQVPRDVRRFCPRFYEMPEADKRAFWAYFFQALAGAEAGLNPKTRVRHTEPEVAKRDPVTGLAVRSEGLLQLSYQESQRYNCDFDWQADRTLKANDPAKTILQPKNNLTCGVKILSNQIIDQRKPLLSRSSYWSTLQPGRPSYRIFARQMTNPPAACGLHEKAISTRKPRPTHSATPASDPPKPPAAQE
jgi:hypothetical protein